jgi:aryl-alcohol dehydrogenase-like predicted oxidoreductase
MKIALGTVQLGVPYGVANQTGMPDDATAFAILSTAHEHGYAWLDTGASYGQSESLLGRLASTAWKGSQPQIATKITLSKNRTPQDQVTESLLKLKRNSVEALLLHNETDLDHPRFDEFAALSSTGLVHMAGVSIYDSKRALQGLAAGLGCLQVPCNLFDTSSVDAGVFTKAAETGATIFVRSIFLQGLFFLSPDHPRAAAIPGAVEALRFLRDFCHRHAVNPAQLAMAFGASLPGAVVVLGAETAAQVAENAVLAREAEARLELVERWLRERPSIAKSVYTPAQWPAV